MDAYKHDCIPAFNVSASAIIARLNSQYLSCTYPAGSVAKQIEHLINKTLLRNSANIL